MCPDYKICDKPKCHVEGICLNASYWTEYWSKKGEAEKKAVPTKKIKEPTPHRATKCYYCETEFGYSRGPLDSTPVKKTLDHIIPKSRGGKNIIRNYVASCERCNTEKTNHTPEEFLSILKAGQAKRIPQRLFKIVLKNVENLIETILPYRAELYRQGSITQEFIEEKIAESQEWPDADPELLNAFDWSKPFEAPKIKGKKGKIIDPDSIKTINPIIQNIADQVRTKANSFEAFEVKFMKKFPYAYSLFPPDLLRWTFDNIKNSKV